MFLFAHLLAYFGSLAWSRIVLWCYLCWYLTVGAFYFDPSPTLWLSSVGISGIIGTALILSTLSPTHRPDRWTIFRLFLMPFCVSSYAALIKGRGFVLIFPPSLQQNLAAAGVCALFVLGCLLCRAVVKQPTAAEHA